MVKTIVIINGNTYAGVRGRELRRVEWMGQRLYYQDGRKRSKAAVQYRVLRGYAKGSTGVVWLESFAGWAREDVTEGVEP